MDGCDRRINDLEQLKYRKAWEHDRYREWSPGEELVFTFMKMVKPRIDETIIDLGCGPGRAGLTLHELGYRVELVDIAENCLDQEVKEILGDKLTIQPLWEQLPFQRRVGKINFPYVGYCCDVMEHIPEEKVESVLESIFYTCDKIFFNICFREDHFGAEIEEDLHLTVKPFMWWLNVLERYGQVEARDLLNTGIFYVKT